MLPQSSSHRPPRSRFFRCRCQSSAPLRPTPLTRGSLALPGPASVRCWMCVLLAVRPERASGRVTVSDEHVDGIRCRTVKLNTPPTSPLTIYRCCNTSDPINGPYSFPMAPTGVTVNMDADPNVASQSLYVCYDRGDGVYIAQVCRRWLPTDSPPPPRNVFHRWVTLFGPGWQSRKEGGWEFGPKCVKQPNLGKKISLLITIVVLHQPFPTNRPPTYTLWFSHTFAWLSRLCRPSLSPGTCSRSRMSRFVFWFFFFFFGDFWGRDFDIHCS